MRGADRPPFLSFDVMIRLGLTAIAGCPVVSVSWPYAHGAEKGEGHPGGRAAPERKCSDSSPMARPTANHLALHTMLVAFAGARLSEGVATVRCRRAFRNTRGQAGGMDILD